MHSSGEGHSSSGMHSGSEMHSESEMHSGSEKHSGGELRSSGEMQQEDTKRGKNERVRSRCFKLEGELASNLGGSVAILGQGVAGDQRPGQGSERADPGQRE